MVNKTIKSVLYLTIFLLNFSTLAHDYSEVWEKDHKFDIDKPGKDSYNLRKAGARPMVISSKERFALIQENENDEEKSLFEMLEIFAKSPLNNCDIIIVEGYKNENFPKLEVFRREIGKTFLHEDDSNIFAIASDEKLNTYIPSLDLNNISAITDLLIKKFEIA